MPNLRSHANRIVNKWAKPFAALSDKTLLNCSELFRDKLWQGASQEDLLPEAFAALSEAAFRELGYRLNIEQLMAGIALSQGKLVEMKTGEGKTVAFTGPAYLAALTGRGVHIVTANEYLACRDCQSMGGVFARLGITCAVITTGNQWLYERTSGWAGNHSTLSPISTPPPPTSPTTNLNKLRPCSRKEAYQADITYGTAPAFGFDYLRDNLAYRLEDQVQPAQLAYVFLDEADNILLDEARTPLILTGPGRQPVEPFYHCMALVKRLEAGRDYMVNLSKRTACLTDKGIDRFEEWLGLAAPSIGSETKASLYDGENSDRLYYIDNCLKAVALFHSPDDYLVRREGQDLENHREKKALFQEREEAVISEEEEIISEREWRPHQFAIAGVSTTKARSTGSFSRTTGLSYGSRRTRGQLILIDKNTGRPLPGRRFQNGLHEALEAKEDLEIQPATITRASISLQSFLSLYRQLAGMSGTLAHDRQTFRKLYGLEVALIPPHNRVRRFDDRPQVFKTRQEALVALVEDALKVSEAGAPVLIGTPSVALSEQIAGVLAAKRIRFCLLNARQTGYEAAIIAKAGYPGRITIATNMAGRGTDIKLGGSFESHLSGILEERGLVERVDLGTPEWNSAVKAARQRYMAGREIAFKAGGLHVLGLGLQSSKRLDEQLIGRAGRQGDPGFSRLYLSLEDELVKQNYGTGTPRLIARLQESEKENVSPGNNREYRADSRPVPVANPLAIRILKECQTKVEGRNYDNLKLGFEFDLVVNKWRATFYHSRRLILQKSRDKSGQLYSGPPGATGREICNELENLDQKWVDFLLALDELRQGVAFQALGGRKVLSVYREEAFMLFTRHFGI